MKTAAIQEEAQRLVREFGTKAYGKAREAIREARRHRNARLTMYLAKVAREVARQQGWEVGRG